MSSPNATVAAKSAIDAPVNRPPSVRKDTPVMFRRNVTGFGSGIVCIEYLRGLCGSSIPNSRFGAKSPDFAGTL